MIEYICSFEEEYGFLVSESMKYGEELIRCKDCKHNHDGICGWHYGVSPVDGYRWIVDDDDFCSCGEKKE